ncbi:unnamed protein product [Pelagomonas calceolata]|uniref:Protein tweety homolog n=1 Tax=Pelagomonas calceolata TaxID=35677 RepID=A0A8J2X017_9STRA|nr:unnamed protein product [Pelagomonas calceolata]
MREPQARTNVVEFLHDLPHREPKNAENMKSDMYLDGLITLGCVAAGIGILIMILYAVTRCCCRRRCAKRLDTVSRDRLLWRLGFGLLVAGILAVLVGALAGVNARRHVKHFNNRVGDLEDVVESAQHDIDWGFQALDEIEAATKQISCVDDIQKELLKVVGEAKKILKKGEKEVNDILYPDFCHLGPTNVITAMGDRNEYLAYYLQCEGENPMQGTYDEFKAIYHVMDAAFKRVIPVAEENGICTGPPDAFASILAALDEIGWLIDDGGTLLSCDSVQPLVQKLTYDSFCDEIVQTLFLIWLILGIGGLLTLVALCIAPCVTPALFPDDDDAEDDPKKYDEDPEEAKERDSVSSAGGDERAGDEPATWHGSSVEADDLWPGTTAPAQEVSPRSMEL